MAFPGKYTQTLRAAANRIIPPDDYPGAWEAGFRDFFGDLLILEPELVSDYVALLQSINAEAQAIHQSEFADLESSEQDALLRSIECGRVGTEWPRPPEFLLQMLIRHVSESFYADPGNGGNRDGVSWRMVGYVPHEDIAE